MFTDKMDVENQNQIRKIKEIVFKYQNIVHQ